MKPRKPTFNVTAKGISLDQDHLSGLAWPFFAIFGLLLFGALRAFYRYAFEPGADLMLIVGLWTTFNLVIAGVALGVVAERREPDRFPRLPIDRTGSFSIGPFTAPVSIHSVSAGGCSVRFAAETVVPPSLVTGARCALAVLACDGGAVRAPLVVHLVHMTPDEGGTTFGFSFGEMDAAAYMALADLMYGDPGAIGRFLKKRRAHKNLIVGSWQFLIWGVVEPTRALTYLARETRPRVIAWLEARRGIAVVQPAIEAATPEPAVAQQDQALAPPIVMAMPMAPVREALPVANSNRPVTSPIETTLAELAEATTIAVEFDALAASIEDSHDDLVERPADWMKALLALAAAEMQGTAARERDDVSTNVAA